METQVLKYSDARQLIATGDVLAFRGTNIVSKLVTAFTRSPYSHVGVAVWHDFGPYIRRRLCVMEAIKGKTGIRMIPLSVVGLECQEADGCTWWCKLNDPNVYGAQVASEFLDMWGDVYTSYFQFLVTASKTLQKIFGPDVSEGTHCAEAVCISFVRAGFQYCKNPALVSPLEIVNFTCLDRPIKLDFK